MKLPEFDKLSPDWKHYFEENDEAIRENFWGNLTILKNAEQSGDPYIQQLSQMRYCFQNGQEKPAPFYQSIKWVFDNLHRLIDQGVLSTEDILWPARVFEKVSKNGTIHYTYTIIGGEPPSSSRPVELVSPHIFVEMLAHGYYPVGSAIREHTNQTLSEHDLAHFGGFISCPEYMRCVREGFRRVFQKMSNSKRVRMSLENFNSVYSLRLYYMTEILTIIRSERKKELVALLEMDFSRPINFEKIVSQLEKRSARPDYLYRYLYRIYDQFHTLVNPVGGESRDILNRTRKFSRASRLGTFYSDLPSTGSKFDGSSIYSLYLNGIAALENKRSSHTDFRETLRKIHAPFIGTLIGTSQLTIEDWVLQSVEECPDPESKLYQYLCASGMWDDSHLIYLAHKTRDFDKILPTGKYSGDISL